MFLLENGCIVYYKNTIVLVLLGTKNLLIVIAFLQEYKFYAYVG